jgi:hypothetical protein
MYGYVSVSLLVPVVLLDVVEVITSNDDGPVHLGGDHDTSISYIYNSQILDDTASDGDGTSEWALLVNVGSLDGLLWGLETETNVLPVPHSL